MQRRVPPPNGIQLYVSGVAVEEPFGAEHVGLGVDVGASVGEVDRRHHHRVRG